MEQCNTCRLRGACTGHTGSYCPAYRRRQRLLGVLLVVIGLASILPERDATAALLLVPLGLLLIFGNGQYLYTEKAPAHGANTDKRRPQGPSSTDSPIITDNGGFFNVENYQDRSRM